MKKSFLITLAAVSSVALIGCSSSSDDNKSDEKTPVAPNAVAEKVAATSDYYVYKITNAGTLNIKAVCDEKTDAENLVVDQDQDLVGYNKSAATSDVKCTVSLEGEDSAPITFNAANNETKKEIVSVSSKDSSVTYENDVITVAADDKGHTVTFATKAAPTYSSTEANKLEKKEGAEGTKFIVLAAEDLTEGVAEIPADCQATTGKGKASCDVTLKSADKAAAGKITATAKTDGEVEAKTTNVAFKEATQEPGGTEPAVTVDTTKLEKHASDTTYVKIPLTVENAKETTITSIACQYNNGAARAKNDCTGDDELGFVAASDNTAFFVKAEKLFALEASKSFTITVNGGTDIKPLTVDKTMVDGLAKTHLVDKKAVYEVKAGSTETKITTPLVFEATSTDAKKIHIVAAKEDLISYAQANQKGTTTTANDMKIKKVAVGGSDAANFELDKTGIDSNACSTDDNNPSADCFINVKLKAASGNDNKNANVNATIGSQTNQQLIQITTAAPSGR